MRPSARGSAAAVTALIALGGQAAPERVMRARGGWRRGIVAFELAGPQRAPAFLEDWGPEGRAAARRSLWWDQLFALSYGAFALDVGRGLAERREEQERPRAAAWARLAGGATGVAAACDMVENAALLAVLRDGRGAALARRMALVKFSLLAVSWAAFARARSPRRPARAPGASR